MYDNTKTVLDTLNIRYRDAGNYLLLSCPFAKHNGKHSNNDRKPSFVIKNFCAKCHGCGYYNNLHDFFRDIADLEKIEVDIESFKYFVPPIKDLSNEPLSNIQLYESALDFFSKDLTEVNKYLLSRKEPINPEYLNCELLYDFNNFNLVFPIRNGYNYLIGAEGRSIKYKSHHKYFGFYNSLALANQQSNTRKKLLIVEGLTDMLNAISKINQLNLDIDVWSTLTANLSDWQAGQIRESCRPVYLAYDNDNKGELSQNKALKLLESYGVWPLTSVTWSDKSLDVGDFDAKTFFHFFGNQ